MIRILVLMLCFVALYGCQTPPDLQILQDKNGSLQQQLGTANNQISELEAEKESLEDDIAELNRVVTVLGLEKSSRVTSSTNLRGQVREYVQNQIDSLKAFLLASDLLDYVGGALVQRSSFDEKPVLIVDLVNRIPLNGSLMGVEAYFQSPGAISVKILRPIDGSLVVIWDSQPLAVVEPGKQRLSFPVSVGVEQGDYAAYFLSQPGLVGYERGTGGSRYINEDMSVGTSIRKSSLIGKKEKRAYSMGVFGLLNTN